MRLPLVLALAITSATTTIGCGDEDGDPANFVAVGDMPEAYKAAYCTYLAQCGLFPDQATCIGAALNVVPTLDPNIVAAVGAGRVIYKGNKVKACYDAVANDTCDSTDDIGRVHVPECNDFFVGTVLAGGDCYVNQECVSQRCSGETGTSCTLGTCIGDTPPSTTLVALGMPCTTTSSCVDGAYCAADTDLCTALKGSGEPCTGSTECGYGFACAGPSGMRTCQPLPALGQPCRLDLPCRDEGHVCNTQTMTCMQLGLVGAPCTSSMQCSPFYRCDTTVGMCAKGPSVNESCSTAARCFDAGTYCDPATVTCVPAKEDGLLCQSDLQCASELCDMTTATPVCASPPICF